jgi:formiminotetrahydrofolate cyclodeaminase
MQGALADLPLNELLERVAARTPAPGGGSAIAMSCAVSAGLVEMAAQFAPAGSPAADVGRRAAELRALALSLAETELDSYLPVLEALRLPESDPARQERLDTARRGAADAPLQIAETGAELAETAAMVARSGSSHLAGDAIAAALLAEGACRAAAELVAINLYGSDDRERRRRAAELARRAAAAREEALGA